MTVNSGSVCTHAERFLYSRWTLFVLTLNAVATFEQVQGGSNMTGTDCV